MSGEEEDIDRLTDHLAVEKEIQKMYDEFSSLQGMDVNQEMKNMLGSQLDSSASKSNRVDPQYLRGTVGSGSEGGDPLGRLSANNVQRLYPVGEVGLPEERKTYNAPGPRSPEDRLLSSSPMQRVTASDVKQPRGFYDVSDRIIEEANESESRQDFESQYRQGQASAQNKGDESHPYLHDLQRQINESFAKDGLEDPSVRLEPPREGDKQSEENVSFGGPDTDRAVAEVREGDQAAQRFNALRNEKVELQIDLRASSRGSNRSFAEEVQKEIQVQEYIERRSQSGSRAGSEAGSPRGSPERSKSGGRPAAHKRPSSRASVNSSFEEQQKFLDTAHHESKADKADNTRRFSESANQDDAQRIPRLHPQRPQRATQNRDGRGSRSPHSRSPARSNASDGQRSKSRDEPRHDQRKRDDQPLNLQNPMTDRPTSRGSVSGNGKQQYDQLPFIDDKLSEINDSMAQGTRREKKGADGQDLHGAYDKHQQINQLSDIFDNIDALNPQKSIQQLNDSKAAQEDSVLNEKFAKELSGNVLPMYQFDKAREQEEEPMPRPSVNDCQPGIRQQIDQQITEMVQLKKLFDDTHDSLRDDSGSGTGKFRNGSSKNSSPSHPEQTKDLLDEHTLKHGYTPPETDDQTHTMKHPYLPANEDSTRQERRPMRQKMDEIMAQQRGLRQPKPEAPASHQPAEFGDRYLEHKRKEEERRKLEAQFDVQRQQDLVVIEQQQLRTKMEEASARGQERDVEKMTAAERDRFMEQRMDQIYQKQIESRAGDQPRRKSPSRNVSQVESDQSYQQATRQGGQSTETDQLSRQQAVQASQRQYSHSKPSQQYQPDESVSQTELSTRGMVRPQPAAGGPPSLHPPSSWAPIPRGERRQNRPPSGARMSPAGRNQRWADGRQSRSGSRAGDDSESEVSQSIVQEQQQRKEAKKDQFMSMVADAKKPARKPRANERDKSLEKKMSRMAQDAARAQESQRTMDTHARKKRMQQQEALLADFRKSNLNVGPKKTDILKSEVIHSVRHPNPNPGSFHSETDNFGDEEEFDNVDERNTNAPHHRKAAKQQQSPADQSSPSRYEVNDDTIEQHRSPGHRVEVARQQHPNPAPQTYNFIDKNNSAFNNSRPVQGFSNHFENRTVSETQTYNQQTNQMYEELFFKVMQEKDPKQALNSIVMKDKYAYEKYKDGLHIVKQRIDKALQSKQSFAPQAQPQEHAGRKRPDNRSPAQILREASRSRSRSGAGAGDGSRSGSRNKFFDQYQSAKTQPMAPNKRFQQEDHDKSVSVTETSNASEQQQVQAMYQEYQNLINAMVTQTGKIYLSDLFQQMNFIEPSEAQGKETRLGLILRKQRNMLLLGQAQGRKLSPETEESLKNLFKICCSIMGLRPIQRGQRPIDPKLLTSYFESLDSGKSDKDLLALDQLVAIKGLVKRVPYTLNSNQMVLVHNKFASMFQTKRAAQGADDHTDDSRIFKPQSPNRMVETQKQQQLHDPRYRQDKRQDFKENQSFQPAQALPRRIHEVYRSESRSGSRAGSRSSNAGPGGRRPGSRTSGTRFNPVPVRKASPERHASGVRPSSRTRGMPGSGDAPNRNYSATMKGHPDEQQRATVVQGPNGGFEHASKNVPLHPQKLLDHQNKPHTSAIDKYNRHISDGDVISNLTVQDPKNQLIDQKEKYLGEQKTHRVDNRANSNSQGDFMDENSTGGRDRAQEPNRTNQNPILPTALLNPTRSKPKSSGKDYGNSHSQNAEGTSANMNYQDNSTVKKTDGVNRKQSPERDGEDPRFSFGVQQMAGHGPKSHHSQGMVSSANYPPQLHSQRPLQPRKDPNNTDLNETFGSQAQPTGREEEQEPICVLNIELDGDNMEQLRVYEGDNPGRVVQKFATQHNLSDNAMKQLLQQVRLQIQIDQKDKEKR